MKNNGEKIIELRNKGYTYDQINKETGFSKSTVCYHVGEGQKEKSRKRHEKASKGFKRKVWGFIYGQRKPKKPFVYSTTELRKKGRGFFHTDNRRKYKVIIKEPKIWEYFGKIFPGITSKTKKGEVQAVNQWTGEKDYYENGEPMMFPYMRCKLTDKIMDATGNDVHVDHIDGDRTNNTIDNFSFVQNWANQMKGDAPSYDVLKERLEIMLKNLRKYR